MKNKKIFKVIVLILLLLTLAALVIFRIMFSPDRIKNIIEQTASSFLDMQVDIAGASLHPGQLTLKDINITSRDIEKTEDSLISVRKVRLGFRIIPLLRGRYIFNNAAIEGVDVTLENLPSAEDIGKFFKQPYRRERESLQFAVTKISISESSLNVGAPRLELTGLNLDARASILHQAFIISAAADINRTYLERVQLEGEIDFLRNRGNIKRITLLGGGGRLEGSGTVNNIAEVPHTELRYVIEEFPAELFSEVIEIEGNPEIRGDAEQKDGSFYINWNGDFTGIEIKSDGNFYKPSGRRLRSRGGISYAGNTAAINWYVFEAGPDTFSGTGTIDESGAVGVSIRGDNVSLKNIGEFFPHIERYISGGYSELRGSFRASSAGTSFEGRLNMRDLKVRNLTALSSLYERLARTSRGEFLFETAEADIAIDSNSFVLRSLSVTGPDLRGTGTGTLQWDEYADFTFYPHIRGARIGIRVSGRPDNIRISLK